MIVEDWEKETGAFLKNEARGSGVFVNGSNPWSGNTSLIVQLIGLLWDVWPPLPPEAWLNETHPQEHLLLHEGHLADLGPIWRPALAICCVISRCSSFMHSSCCHQGSTLGTVTYSPGRLSWQSSVYLHL